jgi:hypothetical protein
LVQFVREGESRFAGLKSDALAHVVKSKFPNLQHPASLLQRTVLLGGAIWDQGEDALGEFLDELSAEHIHVVANIDSSIPIPKWYLGFMTLVATVTTKTVHKSVEKLCNYFVYLISADETFDNGLPLKKWQPKRESYIYLAPKHAERDENYDRDLAMCYNLCLAHGFRM